MEIKIHDGDKGVGQPASQVRVTNRNTFDLNDSHDGVPYEFPGVTYDKSDAAKEKPLSTPVTIPPDAAAHIFGYGLYSHLQPKQQLQAMFEYIAKRFGWNTAEREKEGRSREFFRNIDIRPVMFRIVEEVQDEEGSTRKRGQTA